MNDLGVFVCPERISKTIAPIDLILHCNSEFASVVFTILFDFK